MSTSASPELEDPAPRLPTKVFEGHTNEVWSVAYFHDGKRIISGSYDKTVRIWDVESEKQVGESLMHDFGVRSVALFPDERRLVSGGDGVVLWDLEGRTVMWKKEKSEVDGQCVTYSPDGRLIAASHNLAIVLLNAETGEQIRDPLHLGGTVLCLAFSPDGTQLAAGSGSGDAARVRVFDVATGETVVSPFKAHPSIVMELVYILDGQQFTTASYDKSIRVWDAATGQQIGDPMLGHEDWVHQIAPSRDRRRIASSSQDSTVRVWDLKRRRQAGASLRTQDNLPFVSVGWSPDGRSIVGGSTVNIYLWDVPQADDHITIPQAPSPTASIVPPLPSTSRPRANSISSSILNLHAGSQRPNQTSATDRFADDDFFDSSPDLPTLAQPQLPGLTRTTPTANLPTRISEDARPAPRFEKLARMWRQMSTIAQRTHKASRKNIDEPGPPCGNHNATHETQSLQVHAKEIFSVQGINPKPSPRRSRHARRNDEIGMIAPAPGYDRYHSATEEYWYDPQNPPLIDRIFFCMICCGVPKDDDSNISNADPEPNVPTTNAQAGPSHSQNQPDSSAALTTTSANANTSTQAPRLGRFGRLWQHISNAVRRPAHRQQPESHQLQNIGHAIPQPSCHVALQPSCQNIAPTSAVHATPTLSHYATPKSPRSVTEQLHQNIRWTG